MQHADFLSRTIRFPPRRGGADGTERFEASQRAPWYSHLSWEMHQSLFRIIENVLAAAAAFDHGGVTGSSINDKRSGRNRYLVDGRADFGQELHRRGTGLVRRIKELRFSVVALEPDGMRKILPPTYNEQEWDRFHSQLALIGRILTLAGVNVIFDAPLATSGIPG